MYLQGECNISEEAINILIDYDHPECIQCTAAHKKLRQHDIHCCCMA